MKQRAKNFKGVTDSKIGDAYTLVGIERDTKLILAWHIGERGIQDTETFTQKLHEATNGHFQLTTDGWKPYEAAVSYSLGTRKKWENLKAMLALYFAYYNFCRIHSSIRCTPAMESRLTGHVWTLRGIVNGLVIRI